MKEEITNDFQRIVIYKINPLKNPLVLQAGFSENKKLLF